MKSMRSVLWIAGLAAVGFTACNYTEGECYPRGEGTTGAGVGGGVIVPGGPGGFGDEPPDPQGAAESPACNATDESGTGGGAPDEASLQVFCMKPDHGAVCSARCYEKGVPCGPIATHPYKADAGLGQLFSCNDLLIGYMCGYHYPNGDDCFHPIGLPYPKVCSYSGND